MKEPKPYGLNELREMFLKFFESKGHLRLPIISWAMSKNFRMPDGLISTILSANGFLMG